MYENSHRNTRKKNANETTEDSDEEIKILKMKMSFLRMIQTIQKNIFQILLII